MRYFNKRTNKYHSPIVNLDKLWTLVGDEVNHLHPHHAIHTPHSSRWNVYLGDTACFWCSC
jgi:hypothetical protein